MKIFNKGFATMLAAATLCFGLSYTLPAAADSNNTQIRINSNLTQTHISPEEYAYTYNDGTCFTVEHQNGSRFFRVYYEPGYADAGRLSSVWSNYKVDKDPVTNVAYLSYNLMSAESPALEELAKGAFYELLDVADGVNPIQHSEKYRVYANVGDYRLHIADATVATGPSTDINALAGEGTIKGTEVRMRAQPNTNCAILGYFDNREDVRILGYADDWAYVRRDNGAEGFVSGQYVVKGSVIDDFQAHLRDHIRNSGKYNHWNNINYKMMVTDTFCGEGPRAKATQIIKVYEDLGTHTSTLGIFYVSDNGSIGREDNGYIVQDN